MDANLTTVLARNDTNKPVVVLRNLRLGYFSEIDYDHCYHVTENTNETSKLAIKPAKSTRPGWFKQAIGSVAALLAAFGTFAILAKFSTSLNSTPSISSTSVEPFTTVINASDLQVILPNGVNIYAKDQNYLAEFFKVIAEYPRIWEDFGFAKLP